MFGQSLQGEHPAQRTESLSGHSAHLAGSWRGQPAQSLSGTAVETVVAVVSVGEDRHDESQDKEKTYHQSGHDDTPREGIARASRAISAR